MNKNFTEGIIWKQLLFFALPIFFSSIFQHIYNIVDSAIVGHYVGTAAFAAISSAGYIVCIVITFFVGISTGTGIIVSHFYGANNSEGIYKAIRTTVTLSLAAGLILTLTGIWISPDIVYWTKTPEEVVPYSIPYIKIYFLGTVPVLLYNLGSGVLRACGDSKKPLYFLIMSSVLNVLLDILFVVSFKWGVEGAALATIISQSFSAFLVLGALLFRKPVYRIDSVSDLFDTSVFKKILIIGVPVGLQSTIAILGHLIMNTKTNELGMAAIASVNAVGKINNFAWLSVTAIGHATVTFVGQNMGAKKEKRADEVVRTALCMSAAYSLLMSFTVYFFRKELISIFITDPTALETSLTVLYHIAPFYILFAAANTYTCAISGTGNTFVPMLINMFCYCFLRVVLMLVFMPIWPDVRLVALCYPISWAAALACIYIYYLFSKRRKISTV